MRRCAACGKTLPADALKTRKYCDGVCRVNFRRGHRPGPVAEVVVLEAAVEADPTNDLISLEDVARELQRALLSPSTPASSKAGLAKELRAVLAEIARTKPAVVSLIDQLAERRAQRTGA